MKYIQLVILLFALNTVLGDISTLVCDGVDTVITAFTSGHAPDEENQYSVTMRLPSYRNVRNSQAKQIIVEFDSEATLAMYGRYGRATKLNDTFVTITILPNEFVSRFRTYIYFTVKGPESGTVPYFRSIKMDGIELCERPKVGYLDKIAGDLRRDGCGRRQIEFVELIVNTVTSKPGDFPWHAAIYHRINNTPEYQCGGTIIRRTVVLTAAHCATVYREAMDPTMITVVLGKYHFAEGDATAQIKEVTSILVHYEYGVPRALDNDIAILQLKSEITYNDYVQRACIWYNEAYDKLTDKHIYGSVAGWGIDETGYLSPQLKYVSMPLRTHDECILKYPTFYDKMLKNNRKFCAGWGNGTSPCNGDSGGGFMVFVPDKAKDSSPHAPGRWYLMGLVSKTVRNENTIAVTCDPNYYVLFTDIRKYVYWIRNYTDHI